MKNYRIFVISFALLLCSVAALAQTSNSLDMLERTALMNMLSSAELDSSSLCFEKDWDLSTKFKNPSQLAELQNPWLVADKLDWLRNLCADSADSLKLAHLMAYSRLALGEERQLIERGIALPSRNRLHNDFFEEMHRNWTKRVRRPVDVFEFVAKVLRGFSQDLQAIYQLDTASADSLSGFYFRAFSEAEDSLSYKKLFEERLLPTELSQSPLDWEANLKRIDLRGLNALAEKYMIFFDFLKEHAAELRYTNNTILARRSPYGLLLIGTRTDDVYTEELLRQWGAHIALLIEPGGNDTYRIPIKTTNYKPSYIFIDYSGNDSYLQPDVASQFSVCFGLGFSADLAGNDIYRSGDFAFSSGYGIALHQDSSGEDIYQSGLFSQGASFFGMSLLVDSSGDDLYSATTMAQGMGSTCGLGAIIDHAGSDRYFLGAKYTHAPLMPNDYRSMGQGMGFGFRPDFAGGIGMIYDAKGNDKYIGAVYAQGVGYWYATGILIDEKGNDVYNAIYYPQGSGIHLANGYLFDGEGDDAYYTRNGPGQGAGHDWALGVLIDKNGNDAYSIPGGNGLGLNNSVGLFVDSRGDDRYERVNSSSYGFGSFSRSSGAIGLFLDGAGKDSYPDSTFSNDRSWQKGSYGIGRDTELWPILSQSNSNIVDDPLVDSLAVIDDIFAAASEWEVGSAIKRVRHARQILISRLDEAIPYVIENKLDTKSGLEYRALEELIKSSDSFKQQLYGFLEGADSLKAKNSLALIAGTGDSLLIEPIKRLLANGKYRGSCLGALGSIKSTESIELLGSYLDSNVERFRYLASRSLLAINTRESIRLLRTMHADPSFLIQSMVRSLPEDTDD